MVDSRSATESLPYRETVRGSRWLTGLVFVAALAALLGAVAAALDASLSAGTRVGMTLLMMAVAAVLGFVGVAFTKLRIEVDGERFRWWFGGPFGRSVALGEIAAVRTEPYRWMRYGGWGIRWGLAYSVPFSRRGVAVELRSGKRYYVSSNAPDALVAVIDAARVSGGTGI